MENKENWKRGTIQADIEASWVQELARGLTGAGPHAEDVAQESWLALATSQRAVARGRAFLFGTARRMVRSRRRADRTRREHEGRASEAWAAKAAANSTAPDLALERAELVRAALEELSLLPSAQSRAVALRYVDGLAPGEIAEALGCQPATARAHVARGLATIRRRLDHRLGHREAWATPMGLLGTSGPAFDSATSSAAAASLTAPRTKPSAWLGWAALSSAFVAGAVLLALAGATHDGALEPVVAGGFTAAAPGMGSTPAAAAALYPPTLVEASNALAKGRRLAPPSPTVHVETSVSELVRILVTDRLTGEPVSFLSLKVAPWSDLQGANRRTQETDMTIGPWAIYRSDAAGWLQLPATLAADFLAMPPQHAKAFGPQLIRGALQGGDSLAVEVGPTITFEVPRGLDGAEGSLMARPRGSSHQDTVEVSLDDLSRPVRFGRPLTTGEYGPGPWEIEVFDARKLRLGRAHIAQGQGVIQQPAKIELERTGNLLLSLDDFRNWRRGLVAVELFDGQGRRARVFSYPSGSSRLHIERAIPAGDYAWVGHFGPASSRGMVTVLANKTASIVIPVPESDPVQWRFDVDCFGAGDMAKPPFSVSVAPPDLSLPPTAYARPRLEESRTGWTGRFEAPPHALSILHVTPETGWIARPARLRLVQGKLAPRVVVEPFETRRVKVRLHPQRHAATRRARLLVSDASGQRWVRRNVAGFEAELPVDGPWQITVECDSCRLVHLNEPDFAGVSTVSVDLEVGWSALVRVLDAWNGGPVAGVSLLADGHPIGTSDDAGHIRFDRPFLPRRLTLGPLLTETHRIVSAVGEVGVSHWNGSDKQHSVCVERR